MKPGINKSYLLLCVLLFPPQCVLADFGIFKSFEQGSIEDIKQAHQGETFLLTLWSLDCPPCHDELKLLGQWLKKNPRENLIVISTDSIESHQAAEQTIREYGLQSARHWMFADRYVERLRHSIDPDWFGELPRSYFYDSEHHATAHTGVLSAAMLHRWVASSARHETN